MLFRALAPTAVMVSSILGFGLAGCAGTSSPPAPSGSSGSATGNTGSSGGTGAGTGQTGNTGSTGSGTGSGSGTGAAGTGSGATGSSGATGTSGTQSTPDSGSSGQTGATGSTGSSGTTGTSGSSGSPAGDGGTDAGSVAWTCPAGPFTGSPIPSGATVTQVAGVPPSDAFNNTLYNFTTIEGPVWIGDSLFVSEFPGGNVPPSRIIQVTGTTVSVAMADAGSNGLAVDNTGALVGAVHQDGSISRFNLAAQTRTPIAGMYMGNRFISPNDLTVRSDGNIYFSDPNYQGPSGNAPQSATRVYRIAPGTNTVSVVDATLTQPNGVTLSLDENTLYVSSNDGIMTYPVMADGSTGTKGATPFSTMNVDGMGIDCAGNIYGALINTGTIVIFSPSGTEIDNGLITVANVNAVTNVAFGGADHKTLYITTQGQGTSRGLYEVQLNFPGMPY
jgi:gluconolactonase